MERDEIERYVVEQIAIHTRTFSAELNDVKTRLRSLYRNGDTNGGPGFLDKRVEAEDKRYELLIRNQENTHADVQTILLRQAKEDGRQVGRAGLSEEQSKTLANRIGVLTVLIAFLALVVGLFALIEGKKTAEVIWPRVFHSQFPEIAVESQQQAGSDGAH